MSAAFHLIRVDNILFQTLPLLSAIYIKTSLFLQGYGRLGPIENFPRCGFLEGIKWDFGVR